MKLVLSWLTDYLELKPETTTQSIVDGLIQLGHEVDAVHDTGAQFNHVVVGKILERIQHPNADRLGVCTVDVGEAAPRTIVCGASNARAGITVAVALPGAVLPGDFKITKSDKRGIASDGMICSEEELAMAEESEGIWEMTTDAAPGTPLTKVTGADVVLDVAVTPNRGDCLSHLGLARELAALGLGTLKPLTLPQPFGGTLSKAILAPNPSVAPFFTATEVTGIPANAPSPQHVQQRLIAAGLRPKNALVDVTNYVMLALGQPLHAFDASKLTHGLKADAAMAGEVAHGLNDTTVTLQGGEPVVRDGNDITAIGGILGGANSAVSETTTHTIIEAAYFNAVAVSLSGQKHQIITDARSRLERGVDPAMTYPANLMAAHLLAEWTGATVVASTLVGDEPATPSDISYDPAFFEKFIGLAVPASEQERILKDLGFTIFAHGNHWHVIPPTFRTYMTTPEDLTEEILRVVGYEKVKPVLPPTLPGQFGVNGKAITLDRTARRALASAGFLEVMTYSFIATPDAEIVAPTDQLLVLDNPLVDNMTVMRPSLLPGLLNALKHNLAHKESTSRLAEVGKVYDKKSEKLMAAGVITLPATRHWNSKAQAADTFTAKGLAQAVLTTLGAPVASAQVTPLEGHPLYHPGQSGTWQVGPFKLGSFGVLHPKAAKHFGFTAPVAVFELELETLLKMQNKSRPYAAPAHLPVERDLALVVDAAVTADALRATLQNAERKLVKAVDVFDVYTGTGIPAGKKSLAFSLTIGADDRTLTQAEIEAAVATCLAAAQNQHGAEVRA